MITTFTQSFTSSIHWIDNTFASTLRDLIQRDSLVWMDEGIPTSMRKSIETIVPPSRLCRVAQGEASKSFDQLETYLAWILTHDVSQTTQMIVIGGGAVLDAISFVASIYRRGLPLILIPTTLLSMIDASIGGKTALNLKSKNQLGTFYPAQKIYIDTTLVETLPTSLRQEGMVEMIKIALVMDQDFVSILQTSSAPMNEMIRRAIALKLQVVQQDLQDQGVRRLLNFGHTLGHALEASMQFRVSHGRAVAEGMLLELEGNPFYETVKALLNQYDCLSPLTYDRHQLIPFLRGDKKREGTLIDMIHLTALGEGKLVKEPFDQVSQRLRERK